MSLFDQSKGLLFSVSWDDYLFDYMLEDFDTQNNSILGITGSLIRRFWID